ncbi:unnamed protein product [Arctogadus glacialis]
MALVPAVRPSAGAHSVSRWPGVGKTALSDHRRPLQEDENEPWRERERRDGGGRGFSARRRRERQKRLGRRWLIEDERCGETLCPVNSAAAETCLGQANAANDAPWSSGTIRCQSRPNEAPRPPLQGPVAGPPGTTRYAAFPLLMHHP